MKAATKLDVSVIMVNYFTAGLCAEAIKSFRRNSSGFNYEIIVVDNSNNDEELKKLNELCGKQAQIINPNGNLGFGRANNLGASKAAGEYLFLLNSDTLLLNNAVDLLLSFLKAHPDVGIVGPNLFTAEEKPNHSFDLNQRNLASFKKENSVLQLFRRNILKKRDDFNFTDEPLRLEGCVIGAALLISKALFDELGGFDDRIFMFAEESLLCYQCINNANRLIYNVPQAKIIHLEGASFSEKAAPKKAKYWTEGNFVYFKTAFGEQEAFRFLTTAQKIYARKTRICRLMRKKGKAAYYESFKNAISDYRSNLIAGRQRN